MNARKKSSIWYRWLFLSTVDSLSCKLKLSDLDLWVYLCYCLFMVSGFWSAVSYLKESTWEEYFLVILTCSDSCKQVVFLVAFPERKKNTWGTCLIVVVFLRMVNCFPLWHSMQYQILICLIKSIQHIFPWMFWNDKKRKLFWGGEMCLILIEMVCDSTNCA